MWLWPPPLTAILKDTHLDKDWLDESVAPASVRDNPLLAPTEFIAVYNLCIDSEVNMT